MAPPGFAADIQPMFSHGQIQCMKAQDVDLASYDYMSDVAADEVFADHANARHVLARLRGDPPGQRMPPGGPYWTQDMLDTFQAWMDGGFAP
jgi:hypothetical protein